MQIVGRMLALAGMLALCSCASQPPLVSHSAIREAPYPHDGTIAAVTWNFTGSSSQRKALGSDLWPCTWAADDALYCAWGDGGGFDGNDDQIGRVSLGFARITGAPEPGDSAAFVGKNVFGQLPYAQVQATFGGKVDSMIAIDAALYASGGLWTANNSSDPAHRNSVGPLRALLKSGDSCRTWRIVSTSAELARGTFLNFGRDNAGAIDNYVYQYYLRSGDDQHVYLQRLRKDRLASPTLSAADLQYLVRISHRGRAASWSSRESQAVAVFFDSRHVETPAVVYDAPLKRYLLTVGHFASGRLSDASAGQIGLFSARRPWGPWKTIGYYDRWDGIGVAGGDFLGLTIPTKWISADGRTLWGIFSGPGDNDAFNLVQAKLRTRHRWWWSHR